MPLRKRKPTEAYNRKIPVQEVSFLRLPFTLLLISVCANAQETGAQASANASLATTLDSATNLSPKETDVVAPPTWKVRFSVFAHKLAGPQAILETVPGTASDHVRNFPKQWGRGAQGFGMRLASQYGQFLISESIALGVSAIHHEDPRYFRRGQGGFGGRLGHALSSAVIARDIHGKKTIAAAQILGVYGSWAVATSWNPPDQRTFNGIAFYGSIGLAVKAGGNVFREFWPDVKKKLRK